MKTLIFLILIFISFNSQAAGIRWTDHYPFHKPDNVKVGEYISKYDGVYNNGTNAFLRGKHNVTVDDIPLSFNEFRKLLPNGIAGIGMALVKGVGPSLVSGLVGLVWDEALKRWRVFLEGQPVQGSGVTGQQACMTEPINQIKYDTAGNACVRTCRYTGMLESPWQFSNNQTNTSYNTVCAGHSPAYSSTYTRTAYVPPAPQYRDATDSEILNALNQYLANIGNLVSFINKLINDYNKLQDIYNISTRDYATGPSTLNKSNTHVNTGPDGQKSVTETSTYNLTYNNNNITIDKTLTTTTVFPDNSTTTVTDVSSGGTGTDYLPPNESVPSDICKDNPEILACWGAGTIEEQDIPEIDKSLSISSEKTSAGSCPASIQFTVRGHTYTVSWAPVCTFASTLRPLVILLAWLTSGIFVFYTLSRA